jgi:protein TonB
MLLWALLASILLHLFIGLTMALLPDLGQNRATEEPIFVEVLPPRKTPPPRLRELEVPRNPPVAQRREQPAKRLGPDDRIAPRETAPEGHDTEDRQPAARGPQTVPRPATPPSAPASPAAPKDAAVSSTTTGEATPRPVSPQGEFPPAPGAGNQRPQPTLDQLTSLAPNTRARIESDWRRKAREGVEKGDTVWLDTEHDLLISFFKRFRDNIYNVWNYPERARLREEQGTCLLRIVVSREGTIDDVQLLESSGSRDLDQEAVRAVRKGQPYGPLPRAYPHPQLNIMAYFRYNLGRGFKYPGRISGEQ